MNVALGHGNVREQRLAGHAVVALGIGRWNVPFIAEEDMNLLPGQPARRVGLIGGQQGIDSLGR